LTQAEHFPHNQNASVATLRTLFGTGPECCSESARNGVRLRRNAHLDASFDLLTMAEVARLLHCSKAHVCNLVAGKVRGCAPIRAIRMGRRMLVRRESLVLWVEENDKIVVPERGRKSA